MAIDLVDAACAQARFLTFSGNGGSPVLKITGKMPVPHTCVGREQIAEAILNGRIPAGGAVIAEAETAEGITPIRYNIQSYGTDPNGDWRHRAQNQHFCGDPFHEK